MTTAEFKETWKQIEGKPVNIKYGKSTFRNKVLYNYVEEKGLVYIKDGTDISTRSIKSIELIPQKEIPAAIAVEAEEVVVIPALPEGWNKDGYFIIVGKYGGNWKHVELKNSRGETILQTDSSYSHEVLKEKVRGLKRTLKQSPNYLVDDSFAAPVYYQIKKGVAMDWFFNQIN